MNVGRLCNTDVITVDTTNTLREAAEAMARGHVGAVGVLHYGELVGVFSEADLVVAIAEDASLADTAVEEYMTEDPVRVEAEEDLTLAARRMVENSIGYLFVVRNGTPVGVVSRGDLLAAGVLARA